MNLIHKVTDVTDESGDPQEPVTVGECKDYMRLQGFTDVDQSGEEDYDDDDTLIAEFITTARMTLEEKLGVSIVPKTYEALINNDARMCQLPYGPVISVTGILDSDDEATDADDIDLRGDHLYAPRQCNIRVTYTAGYDSVPKPLVTEIKRMVAYMFVHRGDEDNLEGFKYLYANRYSRRSWLV